MRIFSLLALLSLAHHAWIGLWAVFTDYLTERLMGATGNVLRLLRRIVRIMLFHVCGLGHPDFVGLLRYGSSSYYFV